MLNRPKWRWLLVVGLGLLARPWVVVAQDAVTIPPPAPQTQELVVSATRVPIPEEETPASVSVITAEDLEQKQIKRVADALREIPGLSVVQSGAPGQLTSVFNRGLKSEHTQVLLDGIPINQGLAGLFNFADLTTDNIDRIEVVRGPQSTLYGPRGLAGVIQIFTKEGSGPPSGSISAEAGSYGTFRESLQTSGSWQQFDYSLGASRLDTDNARPNNQYRNTSAIANLGWSPNDQLRLSLLSTYSLSDAGNPNTIFTPKRFDNFLTERWLLAPHLDYRPVRMVGAQADRELRSRTAGKRSKRRRLRRADPRALQAVHDRLSKRSQTRFLAHPDERVLLQ